ncbi:hypothetical protein CR513_01584, partial [Mucuna pruriens]
MAYYRSVRSCPLGTWIPNLEDPEPVISFFYQENAFLLVATDYFTKWVEAEPSKVCLPYQIRFSQTRVESFIFFIRLPSRSRSGSGTGTSSLFDMIALGQRASLRNLFLLSFRGHEMNPEVTLSLASLSAPQLYSLRGKRRLSNSQQVKAFFGVQGCRPLLPNSCLRNYGDR